MWTGQSVGHRLSPRAGLRAPGASAAPRGGRGAASPGCVCWGHGSILPHPDGAIPLQPWGLMSKHSACGHAMTSEEKYTWFLSDVWGYDFINWWNTCQQKPLSSPAAFRSYWQMYCSQRPSVENLCSTLCFAPPEFTRFLLDSIITNYLMRCDLTKTKHVHSKVSKEEDTFHARTAPRFQGLGTSKVSPRAFKRKSTQSG